LQTVNAEAALQLGFLMSLPMLAYIGLEQGFRRALYLFGQLLATGSPLFFTFHLGTKTHYLDRTMSFGGAKCARAAAPALHCVATERCSAYRSAPRSILYALISRAH